MHLHREPSASSSPRLPVGDLSDARRGVAVGDEEISGHIIGEGGAVEGCSFDARNHWLLVFAVTVQKEDQRCRHYRRIRR